MSLIHCVSWYAVDQGPGGSTRERNQHDQSHPATEGPGVCGGCYCRVQLMHGAAVTAAEHYMSELDHIGMAHASQHDLTAAAAQLAVCNCCCWCCWDELLRARMLHASPVSCTASASCHSSGTMPPLNASPSLPSRLVSSPLPSSCRPPPLPPAPAVACCQIARVQKMLGDEYGTASNIKSRVNRLSVLGAITSAQQRLKLYNKVGVCVWGGALGCVRKGRGGAACIVWARNTTHRVFLPPQHSSGA